MWDDDYQEIVSEAEDVWGREAAAVDDAPPAPPPWLATPAAADAAEAPSDAPSALSSAYSPAQGFRRAPPARASEQPVQQLQTRSLRRPDAAQSGERGGAGRDAGVGHAAAGR